MATGGGQNLGNATFTVSANTSAFTAGMNQAQQNATQTTSVIAGAFATFGQQAQQSVNATTTAFSGLQIVPRQLAAINQSIVSLGNNLQGLQQKAAGTRQQLGQGFAFGGLGGGIYQISAFLDDIQYGFRAVVNQVPMLGTSLASALGLGAQQAMAFGGALGIITVGINQISQHWQEWFGTGDQLPKLTQDVDQLGRALSEIDNLIDDLIKKKEEAAKPTDMGNLWGLTKENFSKFDEDKLEELKRRRDEAKKRLREEHDIEEAGPEHTREAREVGARVREAVAELPEGAETLVGTLKARGMSYEQAREAVSQAMRGHSAYLDDILKKLTPEERRKGPLAGLAGATPKAIKQEKEVKEAIKEGDEQARLTEKQWAEEKREKEKAEKKKVRDQREALRDQHRDEMRSFEDQREALAESQERTRKMGSSRPFKGSYFEYATSQGETFIEKQQLNKLDAIHKELQAINKKQKESRRKYEDAIAVLGD